MPRRTAAMAPQEHDRYRRIPSAAGFCNLKSLPRGPNGFPLCRQCGVETPAARRTFCGEECVDAWKCRTQPSHQAKKLLKRDHGVCALCRRDCIALHTALLRTLEQLRHPRRHVAAQQLLKWFGIRDPFQRLWHVDHVVPVSEGGGSCGLENLRTLCRWCHHRETAALFRRRAAARKAAP